MIMRQYSTCFFNDPSVMQSRKSCRYTTNEIREKILQMRDASLLPINMDFLRVMKTKLWLHDKWNYSECINKAIYLATAMAFDTGRRLGHFTHRDGPNCEDHCLRNNCIRFKLRPCGLYVMCGEELRTYFRKRFYNLENVESIEIIFPTQKQGHVNVVTQPSRVYMDRSSTESSNFIDMFTEWMLRNKSKEDVEIFTWTTSHKRKLLTKKQVSTELKLAAISLGVNPKRINTSSIRKAYATIAALNGTLNKSVKVRAGWKENSKVPEKHYVLNLTSQGAMTMVKQISTRDLASSKRR